MFCLCTVGLDCTELFVTLIHVYTCPMKGELWSVCLLHTDKHPVIFYAIYFNIISVLHPYMNKYVYNSKSEFKEMLLLNQHHFISKCN